MASGPDLFVVCKKCGSEVSPYITECPYCGTRLRKRAPKLERGGVPKEPKAPRRRRPTLGRLKPGEIPGIRGDRRPYATISLVLASIVVSLAVRIHPAWLLDLQLLAGLTDEYYRTATTLFVFFASGVGGMFLAIAGEDIVIATGGNGAALGLLAAWSMRDVLGRRRGVEDDSDLLGALAMAAILILLPLATEEASALAGLGGGVVGVVLGLF